MAAHAPAGGLALLFIACWEQDNGFPKQLSTRLDGFSPLLGVRVGGLINFMVNKGMIDANCSIMGIRGDYPNNIPATETTAAGYAEALGQVKASLKQLMLRQNLQAVMSTVVGIQNDLLMMGFGAIGGAASDTVTSTYSAASKAKNAYDAYDKVSPRERAKQLKDWVKSQRGTLPDIFVSKM